MTDRRSARARARRRYVTTAGRSLTRLGRCAAIVTHRDPCGAIRPATAAPA